MIVALLDATTCSETVDEQQEQQSPLPYVTLVDQLTKDYLDAEKTLWQVIEKREDSTLQQIYNIHTDFLNRHYGESNVLLSGIYMDTVNPKLINNIISINETSHDIAREFFEHRNYTVLSMKALTGINLDKTFQSVCEQTINSNGFWEQLKNVSDFLIELMCTVGCSWICISVFVWNAANKKWRKHKRNEKKTPKSSTHFHTST